MSALLALIPGKDLLYGGIIIALVIGFGVFVHHERSIGAARQVAADTKLADEVNAHNTDLQTAAANTDAAVKAQYEKDLQTLATPAPHVVCHRLAPSGNQLPQTAGGLAGPVQGPGAGVPASADGSDDSDDIGPPLTLAGHKADVTIEALQKDVQTLLTEMLGAK